MLKTQSPLRALCVSHLQRLKDSVEHVRMAAVCSTDGFPIALLGVEPQPGRKLTAMAAALDGLSKSMGSELEMGLLEGTVLESEFGLVLCRQVHSPRRNLVLLLVMAEQGTYGHALWAIKNAAKEMGAALQELVELETATPTHQ